MPELTCQVQQMMNEIQDKLKEYLEGYIGSPLTDETRRAVLQTVEEQWSKVKLANPDLLVGEPRVEGDTVYIHIRLPYPMHLDFGLQETGWNTPINKDINSFTLSKNLLRPDGPWKITL